MKITAIKTEVVHINDDAFVFLDKYVPADLENKVLVVTSKILAMFEGSVIKPSGKFENQSLEKHELAKKVSDYYTDPNSSKYNLMLTIIHNTLLVNGGIDSSNAQGHYILLPKYPYKWAENIWSHFRKKFNLSNFGVIVTDSKSYPLKWGCVGTALSYCGFKALNNKVGTKDLFGRKMEMTYVGVAESIAIASVLEMGEVAESQPLCIVEEISQIEFVDYAPTQSEIELLKINIEDDVFAPILMKADWKQTKKELK